MISTRSHAALGNAVKDSQNAGSMNQGRTLRCGARYERKWGAGAHLSRYGSSPEFCLGISAVVRANTYTSPEDAGRM